MTQQVCVISSLTLEFPSKVMFQNLNFTLPKAQVSALIGRNGQGKSLLMQLLHQDQHSSPHFQAKFPGKCIMPIYHNCIG